ncbi:MAG: hypothetical protein IPI73_17655 [Betaproteobacteria bacterium]|nr:hypothetical protein [Betaproteobacteria bacterium]
MGTITTYEKLEDFGRIRLSQNFFMRDFLYSEIAAWHGLRNVPTILSRPTCRKVSANTCWSRFRRRLTHPHPLRLPLAPGQQVRQRQQAQLCQQRSELRSPHLGLPRCAGQAWRIGLHRHSLARGPHREERVMNGDGLVDS